MIPSDHKMELRQTGTDVVIVACTIEEQEVLTKFFNLLPKKGNENDPWLESTNCLHIPFGKTTSLKTEKLIEEVRSELEDTDRPENQREFVIQPDNSSIFSVHLMTKEHRWEDDEHYGTTEELRTEFRKRLYPE